MHECAVVLFVVSQHNNCRKSASTQNHPSQDLLHQHHTVEVRQRNKKHCTYHIPTERPNNKQCVPPRLRGNLIVVQVPPAGPHVAYSGERCFQETIVTWLHSYPSDSCQRSYSHDGIRDQEDQGCYKIHSHIFSPSPQDACKAN